MTRLPEEDEAGPGADSLNLQGDSDTQVHESHGSPKLRLSEISSEHTVMTLPKTKNSRKKKKTVFKAAQEKGPQSREPPSGYSRAVCRGNSAGQKTVGGHTAGAGGKRPADKADRGRAPMGLRPPDSKARRARTRQGMLRA